MLIRKAEINLGERIADVRIERGLVTELGEKLRARPEEDAVEAEGAALIPSLHDHHIHLVSLAASLASLHCGPPQVNTAEELSQCLRSFGEVGRGWIRGVGYHDSVAGEIDRDWLDQRVPDRPVRIQHRSGRLWILNSRALELLDGGGSDGSLERKNGRLTGRLYDADRWLRTRLRSTRPSLHQASQLLASYGVTGVTDTTPSNGLDEYRYFAAAAQRRELLQNITVMGNAELDGAVDGVGIKRGAHKFHLHESELPDLDAICALIRQSHVAKRPAAFHCVTRTELVFALGALREAGTIPGDRIEHAAIAPPELVDEIKSLGLLVVTQPNFITERGDAYLAEVEADDQPWLYRLRGFLDTGVPLAGSTDAPFGEPNPWAAMQAAVTRQSHAGALVGVAEALTPEEALGLFATVPERSGHPIKQTQKVELGALANLCLLDRPWSTARNDLAAVGVRRTIRSGQVLWADD